MFVFFTLGKTVETPFLFGEIAFFVLHVLRKQVHHYFSEIPRFGSLEDLSYRKLIRRKKNLLAYRMKNGLGEKKR